MAALNLSRHLDRIRTEPGLKRNVIALVVLVVLALGAGGWILSNQRFEGPWEEKFEFAAEFEAVPGISPGNGQEVRIAGVIVGQITGAEVNDHGNAQLLMTLDEGHTIYRDARLVLRPKSPLNEMYVEVDPGTARAGELEEGATIPLSQTVRPVQVDEVLAALDSGTRSALTSLLRESDAALATAPRHLAGGLDELGAVGEQLRPVADELDERRALLKRLVTSVATMSAALGEDDDRLIGLAADLETTFGVLAESGPDLDRALAQLPEFATRLRSSTAAVNRLGKQLDPTLQDVAAASDTLPDALKDLSGMTDSLDEALDAAGPALLAARPVVNDLRPFAHDARAAMPMVHTATARLDPVTAQLLTYLPDIGAFMVNTRSVTSLKDANGGILRGVLVLTPTSLPDSPLGALAQSQLGMLVP